jgi:ABC-type Fe3+-hydroxamate transport system substrate-binding protein
MKALGILLVALALTGCSSVAPPTAEEPTATPESSEVTAATPDSVAVEVTSIQEQTVEALKQSCTDLSEFTANPDNWEVTPGTGDSAPFEVGVYDGEGGYVVLLVTPGQPYATLALSSNYADSTNALLYYSGCRGFTYDPNPGS